MQDPKQNELHIMQLSKMKISEALVYLKPIAKQYGLKLNRLKDFNTAKLICTNLYNSTI